MAEIRASFASLSAWLFSLSGRVQILHPLRSTAWPSTHSHEEPQVLEPERNYISLMRSACFCFMGSAVSGLLLWEITLRLSQYKVVVGIGGTIPTEATRKINKDITAPRSSPR
jgi:hypothetical protein